MISPCIECDDRHESCHSSCSHYKEWRKELDEEKARINKVRNLDVQMAIFKRQRYSNWYNT